MSQKLIQRIGILIHYLLKIWNLSLLSIHWIVNRYSPSLRAEKIFFGFRFLYSVSLKGCVKLVAARCGNHTTSAEYRAVDVAAILKCEFWPDYLGNPEIKYGAKVLTKVSDSHTSCISSVTISASANNFLSWQSYKKIIQCCHVWWMCIRIMARNGHQRALIQLNKCFFAYFICGTAITCPLDDSHWGNIWCVRIKQFCKDLRTILYSLFSLAYKILC